MIPDAAAGRLLRAYTLAVYAACALVSCERTAAAPSAPGSRIVSIGGAVTETVFALGAGARVVGVDTSSTYPPAVERLPRVGYQRTLSAEGILALSPEVVLASEEAGPPAVLEQLRRAGVRVERLPGAKTIDAAAARIRAIGAALADRRGASGAPQAGSVAEALAERVQREADAAHARAAGKGPTLAMVYARGGGTMMVGGQGAAGVVTAELAGGRNAITGIEGYKPLSAEVLIAAAPEVLLVPERGLATLGGEAGLLAIPGVAETPAGKARRIVAFDDLLLLGFGPRLGSAIDELARRLRGP